MAWSECDIVEALPAGDPGPWESEARVENPTDDLAHGWEVKPARREIGTLSPYEAGKVHPNEVGWNNLGCLYEGVGHPVEML